jgi:hypothetical protein
MGKIFLFRVSAEGVWRGDYFLKQHTMKTKDLSALDIDAVL